MTVRLTSALKYSQHLHSNTPPPPPLDDALLESTVSAGEQLINDY